MNECVILWRNTQNGRVGFISDSDNSEEIAVFRDMDQAITVADNLPLLQAFPYQIIELDEL